MSTATWLMAIVVFVFSWLFRFNDPGGSFAGLTDDHFFYLVRAWQILFGDLPVRDFVDHGAPLYYWVGWAVQVLFGRGTLSEIAFSATMLSIAAALTFWLAARASGSLLLGLVAAVFQIFLGPRFYNYPKLLAYAVAIPLLWSFADRPRVKTLFWLALVTAVAFLFRHDHGVFVGIGMAAMLMWMTTVPWTARLRDALIFGGLVLVLLAPYLLFVQANGGIGAYFRQASAWAERDRARAPVVWPGLADGADGPSHAVASEPSWNLAAVVRDNIVAWTFYAEIAIPLIALALLLISPEAFRPSWPNARAKIGTVAVLGVALDAGFLRSPLEARLADPSVPIAILVAWLLTALVRLLFSRRSVGGWMQARPGVARTAAVLLVLPVVFVIACGMTKDLYKRFDRVAMTERPGKFVERAHDIAAQVERDWDLRTWQRRPDRPDLIGLAMYLNACTLPSDRVLVQAYLPEVLALARRAFAGGHADLRPGFFKTDEAQRLTVSRLERQSVPIILLDTDDSYQNFRESFPIVTAYIDQHYRLAGTRVFDKRFGIQLFVRRTVPPRGTYREYDWPCYGSGQVSES